MTSLRGACVWEIGRRSFLHPHVRLRWNAAETRLHCVASRSHAIRPPVAFREPTAKDVSGKPVRGEDEIVASDVRQSAITSQAIGVPALELLLKAIPRDADAETYRAAVVDQNLLGLGTASSREWRFKTLRRLYQLRPKSVLFRALRDLWDSDPDAHPLLACLCAMSQDSVFRATASVVIGLQVGEEATSQDFLAAIDYHFPGAYSRSTIAATAQKAYGSWGQTGHLSEADAGIRRRIRATCRPENAAYALMLGHLQGHRGEALFETIWTQILDRTRSEVDDLAFAASQRGMIEYRNAGGVVEVGFRELLRPMEGELL